MIDQVKGFKKVLGRMQLKIENSKNSLLRTLERKGRLPVLGKQFLETAELSPSQISIKISKADSDFLKSRHSATPQPASFPHPLKFSLVYNPETSHKQFKVRRKSQGFKKFAQLTLPRPIRNLAKYPELIIQINS